MSSYSNYLRGYSLKGVTPIVYMKAKRLNLNIISSISKPKLGKMRFMTYKQSLNTKIFIKRKIFIILDILTVHHSKEFAQWVEKRREKVEIFYLPSYSLELNPDERLSCDLKTHFHLGAIVKNENELKNKVVS